MAKGKTADTISPIYSISVGDKRPETMLRGTIERGSGFSVIKERGESLARRGDCGFPNGCQIWAARAVRNDKGELVIPVDDQGRFRQLSVTDSEYKGELIGLKWGQDGGALIDVRYLKGYPSLDVLYQERILNFRIDENVENSADTYLLQFPNGENDIDGNIEPLLVQHLKWHSYNLNSVSKNPQFFANMFYERNFEQEESMGSMLLDEEFEAGKLVRDAANDSVESCKNLFTIIKAVTDEEPADNKLFSYMKMLANKKPGQIIKAVADYKMNVSNAIEKLKSYEAIDLNTPGALAAGKPKQELILSDLPPKTDIPQYLLDNYCNPAVFNATYKLLKITEKIK